MDREYDCLYYPIECPLLLCQNRYQQEHIKWFSTEVADLEASKHNVTPFIS